MDKIDLRKEAMKLFENGTKPVSIAREFNQSRQWFYKWLKRYQENPNGDWFIDHSCKPNTIHQKLSSQTEQLIIDIRNQLENTRYAQIGAVSIQWEFKKLGYEPPAIWTIDRVLNRYHLVRPSKKSLQRTNSYPGNHYLNVQQMDLVGPRYIKNYGRFYSLNIMAIETHCAQVNPIRGKAAEYVIDAVIRFWKQFGIPDFLQMDNELSFRGSNRHPRSLGQLLRFILSHQVRPIFIPLGEPWRNGVIEHFNDTFDKKFFQSQLFENLTDIQLKAKEFEDFHNHYHRYKANNNRTPIEMFALYPPRCLLAANYQLPQQIPLIEGDIILIRFIRSDRKLNIFSECFLMPQHLVYSYVVALISIESHCLKIYQDNNLIQEIYYPVPVDWL